MSGPTAMRDVRLDALRGLAMLLVVVGHTLGAAYPTTFLTNPVQIVLYSFHLPLFAAVSGYVMRGREGSSPASIIVKRFKSLMVPYFAWYVVWWGVSYVRGHQANLLLVMMRAALSPLERNALWFLYGLFLVNVVFALVYGAARSDLWVRRSGVVALVLFISGATEGIWLFNPSRVAWLYVFFVLGYLFAGPWQLAERKRALVMSCAAIYACSLALIWTTHPSGERLIHDLLGSSVVVNVLVRALLTSGGATGCLLVYMGFRAMPASFSRPFASIGVRSVGIYAMHKRLALLVVESGFAGFWIPFTVALTLSILMTYALERVPVASNLFLGRRGLNIR